jgi:hypothetical protein
MKAAFRHNPAQKKNGASARSYSPMLRSCRPHNSRFWSARGLKGIAAAK